MNKLSAFAFGMSIGLTWFAIIILVGIFAFYILKTGYFTAPKKDVKIAQVKGAQ